ncbi:hypothetical protein AYO38_09505 [bacterium SCGC AG-212-C10]|nr:hypothetical protein AYO38_09505 [bacterium SCGC AG-212-C10]
MNWRFWQRGERICIDVDPAQVTVVRFLLRFGPAPQDRLYSEVAVTSGLDRGTFMLSLADLVSKTVIEPRFQPEDGETWFVLTALGRRLKGKLPQSTRSSLSVYL